MAFTLSRSCTVNHLQVPSTQSDFPVLVNVTDNSLKTTGNGGNVTSASGFDIRPYSDSGLNPSNALTYELERYNGTTGEVVMWVKISSLSSVTDTVFYLDAGDSSLITDGSSTATWSNGFLGVYHLADGSTLNVNSATGSNNGTNHSATATVGQIDGAAGLVSNSSQYVDCGTGMNPTEITISAWIKATNFANAYNSTVVRAGSASNYAALWIKSNGKLTAVVFVTVTGNVGYDGLGPTVLSPGVWYFVAFTYTASGAFVSGYVNGAPDFSTTPSGSGNIVTTAASTFLGNDPVTAGRFWNGVIDEARLASTPRSADWIAIEYNNQKTGSTFITFDRNICGIYTVPSTLVSGITAYYALSDLTDSTGGTSLTNHNSVTFNANGANFVSASSQWLSHADQASFHFGTGDFSFCYWLKTTSNTNFGQLVNYGGRGSSPSFYHELNTGTPAGVATDASSNTLSLSGGILTYNDGNFHLVVVTVARSGNFKVIIDNSTITNSSAAALVGSMNSATGLGLAADETGANKYDGAIKGVGLWNRALTSGEITKLWNSGTPLLYPF